MTEKIKITQVMRGIGAFIALEGAEIRDSEELGKERLVAVIDRIEEHARLLRKFANEEGEKNEKAA